MLQQSRRNLLHLMELNKCYVFSVVSKSCNCQTIQPCRFTEMVIIFPAFALRELGVFFSLHCSLIHWQTGWTAPWLLCSWLNGVCEQARGRQTVPSDVGRRSSISWKLISWVNSSKSCRDERTTTTHWNLSRRLHSKLGYYRGFLQSKQAILEDRVWFTRFRETRLPNPRNLFYTLSVSRFAGRLTFQCLPRNLSIGRTTSCLRC